MGRFSDPCSERLAREYEKREKRKELALACLWKPKKDIQTDSFGSYFTDDEHLKKVIEEKKGSKNECIRLYRPSC